MSATPSTSLPAPPRYLVRLLIGSLLLLALALVVAITMPYLAGKSRLARLHAIDPNYRITRLPVTPRWIRRILGHNYGDTVDPINYINIDVSREASLETIGELNELTAIRLRLRDKTDCTAEWLSPVLRLPSLRHLEIVSVDWAPNGALVSARTIRAIAACRELTDLSLVGVTLANDWCDGLKDFRCLKNLTISSRELTPLELDAVASLPMLESILINARQDNFLLPVISGTCTGRRWCYGTKVLTPESLKAIHQANGPAVLGILCSDADEDALSVLSEFSHLKSLEIISTDATENPFLSNLGACPVLTELRIETNPLGIGLSRLPDLPMLEKLILEVQTLDEDAFDSILKYDRLKSLRLCVQFELTDCDERIRELKMLDELDLDYGPWPIETLSAACSLPDLKWLRFVASTGMTDSLMKIEVASPHLKNAFEQSVADLHSERGSSPTIRQIKVIEIGERTTSAAR